METATPPISGARISSSSIKDAVDRISPILSQHVAEEEDSGRLSPTVVKAMRATGLFKLFLPKSLGGSEIDPLTMAKLVEQVGSHNTAAGWSLMVSNTTLLMLSRIPEEG